VAPLLGTKPHAFSQLASWAAVKRIGWSIRIQSPPPPKCVLVGAHHTSGAELWLTLLFMGATGIKLNWVAKDSLFVGPVGWWLRRMGGIPVNRRARSSFVQQMVDLFAKADTFHLAIMPEGTRESIKFWKSGFYYIALGAGVPIVLAYADYASRVMGLGPTLIPSGDIEADLAPIREFYTTVTARHPEKQSEVMLQPRLEEPAQGTPGQPDLPE